MSSVTLESAILVNIRNIGLDHKYYVLAKVVPQQIDIIGWVVFTEFNTIDRSYW